MKQGFRCWLLTSIFFINHKAKIIAKTKFPNNRKISCSLYIFSIYFFNIICERSKFPLRLFDRFKKISIQMFYAVLLMKWKIYIVVKQKKGSWPLDLLEKSVSFIKRILKQKLNWYISKPKLLLFADIIKNELSIQVFEKKQTPKEKLCDGDSWNLWFKQGKNIEAKKKTKTSQPNLLIS